MGNMKKYKSLVIVVVLIVVGASCTPLISGHTGDLTKVQDTSIKEDFDCKYSNDFIPGEIIVKFKSGISPEIRTSERILKTGITSIDTLNEKFKINNVDKIFKNTKSSDVYGLSNFYKFVFPENSDIFSLIEEYQMDPNVEFVGPNPIMSAYLQPNDPYYYSSGSWEQDYQDLWGLHKINVSAAWNITTGSNDIVVAVIDTGIDYNHEEIAGNMWINDDENPTNGVDDDGDGFIDNIYGADIYYNDSDPMDGHGHGTHCAGTIAAVGNNTLGVVGVNWHTKIMSVKALSDGASAGADILAAALVWAADNGADILSNSWGSEYRYPREPTIEAAIQYAYDKGCLLVFAAGNSEDDVKYYCPQNMAETISVAATDYQDEMAIFTNFGELVDVSAPGVEILSLRANNTDFYGGGYHIVDEDYYYASGTSMACPHVAGLAALLLSKNQSFDRDTLRTIIEYSTDEIDTYEYIGKGRINASKAIQMTPAAIRLDSFSDPTDVKGTISITGTAWGGNFHYYTLEYERGQNPDSWIEIINSTVPVQDDVLASVDTTELEEGFYELRLRLKCNNDVYEKATWMIINNEYNIFIVDNDGGQGVDYICIQDAIDDAGYKDTIYVLSGTYNECIVIDKTIDLIGEDKTSTIIDGDGWYYVVSILANNVNLSGFTIQNNDERTGISIRPDLFAPCGNTVSGNIITNNGRGITVGNSCYAIGYSSYNNVVDNIIIGNSYCGIFLGYVYHTSINLNTISDNTLGGIYLYNSAKFNTISRNIITDNDKGILFNDLPMTGYNNNNTIYANTIEQNTWGIYLKSTLFPINNNIIYHNNFVNNANNAYDPFTNYWYNDTLREGNYWSDFDESCEGAWDNDSNGIVDSPYEILGGDNQDLFPFINMSGWNTAPEIPLKPSGPRWGRNNKSYTYRTSTTDQDGDQVYYNFSWDDGTYSGWIGPNASGEEVSANHSWNHGGQYQVKVKAKDIYGAESDWSEPLTVRILHVAIKRVEGPIEAIDVEPVPP